MKYNIWNANDGINKLMRTSSDAIPRIISSSIHVVSGDNGEDRRKRHAICMKDSSYFRDLEIFNQNLK